jgi:hypothetical protein
MRTAFDMTLPPAVLDQIESVGANGRPALKVAKDQKPDGLLAYPFCYDTVVRTRM